MKAVPNLTMCAALVAGVSLIAQKPAPTPAESAEAERVQVTFVSPENFADFRDGYLHDADERGHLQEELTKHLVSVGKGLLLDGQRLEIRFLDIDLAGDFEPWRGPQFDDIRIIKDLYPPRAVLEFRLLVEDGSVIREGRRELSDLGFMMSTPHLPSHDSLRHDKSMLTDWMRREFRRPKKS